MASILIKERAGKPDCRTTWVSGIRSNCNVVEVPGVSLLFELESPDAAANLLATVGELIRKEEFPIEIATYFGNTVLDGQIYVENYPSSNKVFGISGPDIVFRAVHKSRIPTSS